MSDTVFETMTFDHTAVSVASIAASMKFYAEVLGFTTIDDAFALPAHEIRGQVIRNASGVRIELFERVGSRPNRAGHHTDDTLIRGWFQLALAVADVRATFARVVAAGARPVMEPRIAPDGATMVAFIADPDDNLVEFVQRQPAAA